jgi:hypothetical protein
VKRVLFLILGFGCLAVTFFGSTGCLLTYDDSKLKLKELPKTFVITGTVTGDSVSDVTLTLSGDGTGTAKPDGSGTYHFDGLVAGTYTITPGLAGHVFHPLNVAITVTDANATVAQIQSSASAGPTYGISGTIAGAIAAGVLVTLSGDNAATTRSDPFGQYVFAGLTNGSYS